MPSGRRSVNVVYSSRRPSVRSFPRLRWPEQRSSSATGLFSTVRASCKAHRLREDDVFLTFWKQTLTPAFLNLHLDRWLISNANDYPSTLVGTLLQPLSSASNLRLPYIGASYLMVLQDLVRRATSFHTMMLEYDRGPKRTSLSE